jgi:hypothetical protein
VPNSGTDEEKMAENSGQQVPPATTPSNEELKDAIRQYKEQNPDSTFKMALNFARSDKAWFVSESRLKKIMVELGFLQNRDDESYLEGRMESLLDSGSGEISFMVGPLREVVKAHRIIVYHNCPLLFENYPIKADNTVEVPEISPETFKIFVRFLYIARVKQATADTAKELLLLSKKVGDDRLCGFCVDMLASQLSVNNICDIFCLCSSNQLPDSPGPVARLRQLCGSFFNNHQKEVLFFARSIQRICVIITFSMFLSLWHHCRFSAGGSRLAITPLVGAFKGRGRGVGRCW